MKKKWISKCRHILSLESLLCLLVSTHWYSHIPAAHPWHSQDKLFQALHFPSSFVYNEKAKSLDNMLFLCYIWNITSEFIAFNNKMLKMRCNSPLKTDTPDIEKAMSNIYVHGWWSSWNMRCQRNKRLSLSLQSDWDGPEKEWGHQWPH